MSSKLYVRIRGRVHGPFDHEKIKTLVARGQVSRVNHISEDQVRWERADSIPELFEPQESIPEPQQSTPGAQPAASPQPVKSEAEWYYGEDDQTLGPFDIETLKTLLRSGAITKDQMVWKEGLPEWVSADSVPELQSLPHQALAAISTQADQGSKSSGLNSIADSVKKTTLRVILISIYGYFFGASFIIGGIFQLIVAIKAEIAVFCIPAISLLMGGGLFIAASYHLGMYYSHLNAFIANAKEDRLKTALASLNKVWIIVAFFLVGTTVSLLLFFFAVIAFFPTSFPDYR